MLWRKKAAFPPPRQVLRCSFCNKMQDNVDKLIAGPSIFICDECVEVCNDIIADDNRVAKQTGRQPAKHGAGGSLKWPNPIACALCRTPISSGEGLRLEGNRGTLCEECVKAVEVARPR